MSRDLGAHLLGRRRLPRRTRGALDLFVPFPAGLRAEHVSRSESDDQSRPEPRHRDHLQEVFFPSVAALNRAGRIRWARCPIRSAKSPLTWCDAAAAPGWWI